MRINSINSTTPKFKGIREDRNATSQLSQNNTYSLTEPNQRRINKAIENLAKQRGEENIRFLLNVGENLTYQTNIPDAKPTKNEWRSKLKGAVTSSLAISDPILKSKYEPEIKRVFDEKKPLTDDEKELILHKESILDKADLDSLKSNPNENIRNLKNNMDYFISSTETPIKQKLYVMKRLDYMMSPEYKINSQLKDKKTQVLAEMINDMVINTPESKVPNMKAVNQKTHGMCAAISIARKTVAYEDKANYVDTILSELDDSPNVMVYDRHNLGSGKRVPVEKTYVDFDYAQEKGYRIIDASTLQWMGIAGMYGNKNEKLEDFFAFDKENFDAFHDSFFLTSIRDDDLKTSHAYFQSLVKAKDEIGNVKAKKVLKRIGNDKKYSTYDKNVDTIAKYNKDSEQRLKNVIPDMSKQELHDEVKTLLGLYAPTSEKIKNKDEKIRQYAFLSNEETSQKQKKVSDYLNNKYGNRIGNKDIKDSVSILVDNIEKVNSLEKEISTNSSMSDKIKNARDLYTAESVYRASVLVGLQDKDILTDYLIHYNIPDNETRISEGYAKVINAIENKDDKKLLNHYTQMFGLDSNDKESVLTNLKQIKESVDFIQTQGLDSLYYAMGFGDRKSLLNNELASVEGLIKNGDKDELNRISTTLGVKNDKKHVLTEINKMQTALNSKDADEKTYKHVLNKLGYKNEMNNFPEVFSMFVEKINNRDNDEEANIYTQYFKSINGLDENCSQEELKNAVSNIGQTFNMYSQSMTNAGVMLNVLNDDGSMYYTADGGLIVLKKMENEGKLVKEKDMRALQTRFNKIDKLRSSDEFSSRQGKISDPELYKLSSPEKSAINQISKKLNNMYSDVVKEHTRMYRLMREPLEKHARYVGTNEGKYWVNKEGSSGLSGSDQVKILEQMTDRPYQMEADIDKALDFIKNTQYSGVSSTSVFNDKHGWHAQYVVDVDEVGKSGKTAIFHDNTWGASEHENTWVDSEGLTRTDYSDHRGGEFGYITNNDWRNGNYVDNLTKKAGHITPHDVDNKIYKKLNPQGSEYDFSTISNIIVSGVSSDYKDIAASIKDTIFIPDSTFLPTLSKNANSMTSKEIQKAIFRNETAGMLYKTKFENIQKRLKGDMLKSGINSIEDYNKLSDDDPLKITFEKAAIRNAYSDESMYNELGSATTMKDVMKIKKEQRKKAIDNFDYAFGKSSDILLYLGKNHQKDIATIVINVLKDNNLPNNKAGSIVKNIVVPEGDEKSKITGSLRDTINFVLEKTSRQFDENMEKSEVTDKAKTEIISGLKDLMEQSLYFNKDDLKLEGEKSQGIRNWVDEKFNPTTDEEFVKIYNKLQDMTKEEFVKLREGITDKQLGMSSQTGYDMLVKFKASNNQVEDTVRNVLFYDEYSKDIEQSKIKSTYKYNKLERNVRGAVYVGKRTFDDLYRTMNFSLAEMTYEKMFDKYKDKYFREYGVFPAYPKVDLTHSKALQSSLNSFYTSVDEIIANVAQKKTIDRDYALVDELKAYVDEIKPDKKPTSTELKHVQNLLGEFVTLNMNDTSIEKSLNAAYNILDFDSKNVTYDDLKSNVNNIVTEFDVIKKANSTVNLKEHIENLLKVQNDYVDTLLNVSIPQKYQRKVKEDAMKWQSLEVKLLTNNQMESDDVRLLKEKINNSSINSNSKQQIESFEKITNLVDKTRILKQSDKPDNLKIQSNEAKISEMTKKYVDKYINPESKDIINEKINCWVHKEIYGGKSRQVTEDDVLDARDKFEQDFYKYHYLNNPVELLNTYVLLSSKDAKEKYPKLSKNLEAIENLLSQELSLVKFVEIQEALMEAVEKGNTAHVKNYFDDYYIDADSKVSMNSDEAIDAMVRSLLLENNTKSAKMFVEKLGLGDRVMEIETKDLHDQEPKKLVDGLTKLLRTMNNSQSAVEKEYQNLYDTINDAPDSDEAIEVAKQNVLKSLKRKSKDKTVIKAYMAAFDDVKKVIKENPDMNKNIMLESVYVDAKKQIQDFINQKVGEKQEELNSYHSMCKFLFDLKLPEYSKGYQLQQELIKEYNEVIKYNNEELTKASGENNLVQIRTMDEN